MPKRLLGRVIAAALVSCVLAATASAQSYPTKPIKLIAPNPPGGGFDFVGRAAAAGMTPLIGKQVVVENKTGSGTLVGTDFASKAAPDGYTLLVGSTSNLAINPGLYSKLPYNPEKDFVLVRLLVAVPFMLAVNDKLPVNSLTEFIDYARKNPGKLNYGSAGNGSGQHIAGALLALTGKLDMQHVPYRGAAAAANDLLAGRIQFLVDNAATILGQVKAKKVKAFATTGEKRWPPMPELPTYSEYFKQDVSLEAWFGIFARTGTPKAVIERLGAVLDKMMQDKKTLERFAAVGYVKNERNAADSAAYVAKEMKRWPAFLRQANIRIN